ncbi:hypothetical protein ACIQHU_39420 [Streptomyces tendae]|uniref:hypothetical protein n=1 Tax=Streptomyces tendae TaxID=1932 RepID=UPI00381E0096
MADAEPIRKSNLPCTPPSEYEFHTVHGGQPDSPGVLLVPGDDSGPVVVRRRITYGDWEPVRPDHWAKEPPTTAELAADAERFKQDYLNACKTIADMHAAATGRRGEAPTRGVIEDVEDVRLRAERAETRLRLAHQARRGKEHQLDDVRRALCDIGFMEDDDPYSHADLADVIRQVGETLSERLPSVREQRERPTHPDGTPYRYHEIVAEGWGFCVGCHTWSTATAERPHTCLGPNQVAPADPEDGA